MQLGSKEEDSFENIINNQQNFAELQEQALNWKNTQVCDDTVCMAVKAPKRPLQAHSIFQKEQGFARRIHQINSFHDPCIAQPEILGKKWAKLDPAQQQIYRQFSKIFQKGYEEAVEIYTAIVGQEKILKELHQSEQKVCHSSPPPPSEQSKFIPVVQSSLHANDPLNSHNQVQQVPNKQEEILLKQQAMKSAYKAKVKEYAHEHFRLRQYLQIKYNCQHQSVQQIIESNRRHSEYQAHVKRIKKLERAAIRKQINARKNEQLIQKQKLMKTKAQFHRKIIEEEIAYLKNTKHDSPIQFVANMQTPQKKQWKQDTIIKSIANNKLLERTKDNDHSRWEEEPESVNDLNLGLRDEEVEDEESEIEIEIVESKS